MKTLDEIKDEYAKEWGYDGWEEYENVDGNLDPYDIESIATRFAAEQTTQMKADILDLRKALAMQSSNDNAFWFRQAGAQELLQHTAHYENP